MKITLFNSLTNNSFGSSFNNFSLINSSFKEFFDHSVNANFESKLNTVSISLIIIASIVFIIFSTVIIRHLFKQEYNKALYKAYIPLVTMICLSFSLFLIESIKNQSIFNLNLIYLCVCLVLIALMLVLKIIEVLFIKKEKFSMNKQEFILNILDTCDECGYEFKKENLIEYKGQKICKSCLEELKELEKE